MASTVFLNSDAIRSALHEANVGTVIASPTLGTRRYPLAMPANVMLYGYRKAARASSVLDYMRRANFPPLASYNNDVEYLEHMRQEMVPIGVGGVTATQTFDDLQAEKGFPVVVSETARRVRQSDDPDMFSAFVGPLTARKHLYLGPMLLYCVPTSKTRADALFTNIAKSRRTSDCPTARLVPLQIETIRSQQIYEADNNGIILRRQDANVANPLYLVDQIGNSCHEYRFGGIDPTDANLPDLASLFEACAIQQSDLPPSGMHALAGTLALSDIIVSSDESNRIIDDHAELHTFTGRRRIAGVAAIGADYAAALGVVAIGNNAAALRNDMYEAVRNVCARKAWNRACEAMTSALRTPLFAPAAVLCGAMFPEAVDAFVLPRPNLFTATAVSCSRLHGVPIESAKLTTGLPRRDGKTWDGGAMLLVYRVMTDDGAYPDNHLDVGVIDVDFILNSGLYENLVECAWNMVLADPAAAGNAEFIGAAEPGALPHKGARRYANVPNRDLLHMGIMKRTTVIGGTNMDSVSVRTITLTAIMKGGSGLTCASTFSAYANEVHPFATQMRIRAPLTGKEVAHCVAWANMTIIDPQTGKIQFEPEKHFVPIMSSSNEPAQFFTEIARDMRDATARMIGEYGDANQARWEHNSRVILRECVQEALIKATITDQVLKASGHDYAFAFVHQNNQPNMQERRKEIVCDFARRNFERPYPYRGVLPLSIVDIMRPDWSKARDTPLIMRVVYSG